MYTVKDLLDTSYVNLILGVQDGAINKWEASRNPYRSFKFQLRGQNPCPGSLR